MEKIKVYDLPTRLMHWLFAGLFVGAYAIAQLTDDESPWFSQHMLLGLVLFLVTTLRVLWGIFGSRHTRFFSLPLSPIKLALYFRDILSSRGKQYLAHNPASAWATIAMIGLSLGLGFTGYMMATGGKEIYEDIHELMANAFAFVVVAHIAGLILHSMRHRDGIVLSMIHGKKVNREGETKEVNPHRFPALVMTGIVGLFAFHIYKNYDATQATTKVFGISLQLGENETEEEEGSENDDD